MRKTGSNGERIASSSFDGTVKVLDLKSGKVTYTGKIDGSKYVVICFIIDLIIRLSDYAMSACFL